MSDNYELRFFLLNQLDKEDKVKVAEYLKDMAAKYYEKGKESGNDEDNIIFSALSATVANIIGWDASIVGNDHLQESAYNTLGDALNNAIQHTARVLDIEIGKE